MKIVKGNLLDMAMKGDFDVIIHGCNCFCTMGAGIALQIMQRFPEADEADKQTEFGDKSKLGGYTFAKIIRGGSSFHIVNAYTQFGFGVDQCDYNAINEVFKKINMTYTGMRIGYPKIGAGLAGGDWNVIEKLIETNLKDQNHTLVIL